MKWLSDWLYNSIYWIVTMGGQPTAENKQTLFITCADNECDNELCADPKTEGEYIDEDKCKYRYRCGSCGFVQTYDFCLAPVPIKVDL